MLMPKDFADVKTVMSEMGKAMMGTGEAEDEGRALTAAEAAIANPLLDEVSLKGASGVLINITGGMDMTLYEVDEAANYIREQVDPEANIIFGSTFDSRLNGKIRVSVVATGIKQKGEPEEFHRKEDHATKVTQKEFDLSACDEKEGTTETSTESFSVTAPKSCEESPKQESTYQPSFLERIGLKKRAMPDTRLEKAEFSVEKSEGTSLEDVENIPAFLRRKRKDDA